MNNDFTITKVQPLLVNLRLEISSMEMIMANCYQVLTMCQGWC